MISFVSSVCPAPNVERDRDLIRTFKKGKKQKSKLKKKNNNYSQKFLLEIHLLSVIARSETSHLVEKQQAGDKANKELAYFFLNLLVIFTPLSLIFYHVPDRLPRADSTYSHEDIKINSVKPQCNEPLLRFSI